MNEIEIDRSPTTQKGPPKFEMVKGNGRTNYVPAVPTSSAMPSQRVGLPQESIMLDVTPTATANIDMRTSAQDRAIGFLISSVPRTFAFSLAITILSIVVGGVTLVMSFVILFGTFSVVELASYVYTLAVSAEGVAFYEARQKWAILRREQTERWAHYKRLNGGE